MQALNKLRQVCGHVPRWTALAIIVLGLAGLLPGVVAAQNLTVDTPTDCDDNAVIYCGASTVKSLIRKYNNGDGKNSAGSIHDIFNHFGISSADINSLDAASTTVVAGKVTNRGNVYDDQGNIVATDAQTGGRQNMPGSTRVTSSGTTFYTRPPSVSFQQNSLSAFVVMRDGRFAFAIIASCGNAVKAQAKAVPKPSFTLNKLVAKQGSSDFAKAVTVQSGETVTFKIEVKSTGNAPLSSLTVADRLPPNMAYVDRSLMQDGSVSSGQTPFFNSNGVTLPSPDNTTFTFDARVGQADRPDQCNPETLIDTATASVPNLPPQQSTATVNKTCVPPPVTTTVQIPAPPPAPPPPPAAPVAAPQPAALVNVGPGSLASLFVTVCVLGSLGYHYLLRYRLSK